VALRHDRHVLALADHASFRKASRALAISQPAPTESLFKSCRLGPDPTYDKCSGQLA
jgi:hypothetical protein